MQYMNITGSFEETEGATGANSNGENTDGQMLPSAGLTVPVLQEQLEKAAKVIAENDRFIYLLEKKMQEQENGMRRLRGVEQQYKNVAAENERLKEHLAWYRRTYETRSLPGVVKEIIQQKLRPAYVKPLNVLLASAFVQKKYALTYMLEFAKANGMSQSIRALVDVFREEGFKAVTNSTGVARDRLRKSLAVKNLPSPYYKPDVLSKQEMLEQISQFATMPKISVIMPVYNTNPVLLALAIQSVQNQVYENWELCIVDDQSTYILTKQALEPFATDARISIQYLRQNAGISAASNAAIEMTTGEYIALLDHDDEITHDALFWITREINAHEKVDVLYSDECKVDEDGILSDFFLKPDWSPELLFNMMYTGHLTVYRKAFLVHFTGPFRKQYDFSQDYDLMLRAAEKTDHIRHIKKVLYHWRLTSGSASQGDKPYARATNIAALEDAVQRRGLNADVIELPHAHRVKLRIDRTVMVSIIIPTDSFNQLHAAVESIISQTIYPSYEIIVVTNSGLLNTMRQFSWDRVVYVPYDLPYNFSDKCNHGAARAKGACLIFFNDDVRPLHPDWIEHTIEMLFLPGIGGVSPKLLYENDTIQYAGMATGVRGLTGTTYHGYRKNTNDYFSFPQLLRNVSILSGACLAIKKTLFSGIGGFDAVNTPSAHSDVDLSFKIQEQGLRCVYTPYATLRHIGHLSLKEHDRKAKAVKDKADIYLLRRWMKHMAEDIYFPRPMVSLVYHDSPEPYTLFPSPPEATFGSRGDVLLVSHDFSLSGAPIMLYNICKLLVANGYYAIVCCPTDGPLRRMYQRLGVPVIIDTLVLLQHHSFAAFAKNFDYIICNTVITWPVVRQMQQTVTTVWWIQEAKVIDDLAHNLDFVRTMKQSQHVIGVSEYAIAYLSKYNSNYKKIYNTCYDDFISLNGKESKMGTLIFSIIGSVEHRKGQDILFDALNYIPEALLAGIEVWVIGKIHDPAFYASLQGKVAGKPYIYYKGEVSNDMSLSYIRQSDVIISASRDDPFPVVLIEAFAMAKACIVSENTGITELIEEGSNGFTFYNEDARGLAEKISFVLNNRKQLEQIGRNARTTYETYLHIKKFERQLLQYMQSLSNGETVIKPPVVKTAETSNR